MKTAETSNGKEHEWFNQVPGANGMAKDLNGGLILVLRVSATPK
ncbi:hypothetical protein MJ584_22920 [Klebsiella pneumoniae]|nr:hypothetical protein MJ584_22920 [Klebsiella pneumoniae]